MGIFKQAPRMGMTLRALSRLLSYPDATLRAHLDELRAALAVEPALSGTRRAELAALLDQLARAEALEAEADYVALFDRGRGTSLHLFEHVHGDSRDRGPAMIDLARTYEQAGLYLAPHELPDYLPAVLEFASTLEPAAARDFLAETAHILGAIFAALCRRQSAYASVLGALLELAGEQVDAVTFAAAALPVEEDPDTSWEEPPAFDGCSLRGQASPGEARPVQFIRKPQINTGGHA